MVGYADGSYRRVGYCGVGYGFVGVTYCLVSYRRVRYDFVGVGYHRVAYADVSGGTAPRFLQVGNLRCRMVLGNVAKDTPPGLDTGGGC